MARQHCPLLCRKPDEVSELAGTLCYGAALSCDDVSLFDNVMVIVRWRVERIRGMGRSLEGTAALTMQQTPY
jgi:hypothetical protein